MGPPIIKVAVLKSSSSQFPASLLTGKAAYGVGSRYVTATGGKTFTYDSENHLVTMGSTVAIQYDGDGNRVAKSVSGTVTRYLVDDLNPTGYPQVVDELNASGVVQRTYTYGLQRISQYQPISGTWTASFYGYDGGGNVRQLTNSVGSITDTYEYDAFGNKINSTGTTPNNMLYRGEEFDPDLGLYYLRARYYNALTGRFLGRDPEDGDYSDPATLHKYVYAGGDPVNLADPTGRAQAATATWGGAGGEYAGLTSIISLGAQVGEFAVAAAVSCALNTAASLLKGVATDLGAPIENISFNFGNCSAKVVKSDRCRELHDKVEDGKTATGQLGKCRAGMSKGDLQLRLATWTDLLRARIKEREECSQNDPNPQGHQDAIDQIWTVIVDCEVLLHEF